MGLENVVWPERSSRPETMTITHNNVLYDGIVSEPGDVPIKTVRSLEQLYPVGSICFLNLIADGPTLTMFLRADIRFEADNKQLSNNDIDEKLSLVSGKTIKVEPLAQITPEYEELIGLYEKIKSISTVNLPDIDIKSERAAAAKVLELMTGYLCTLSFFSIDRLYTIFKTANLQERIPLLLACYKEYLEVLEENWKGLSSQAGPEQREKDAVFTIYEQMKKLVGNPGEQEFVDKIRQKLKKRSYP